MLSPSRPSLLAWDWFNIRSAHCVSEHIGACSHYKADEAWMPSHSLDGFLSSGWASAPARMPDNHSRVVMAVSSIHPGMILLEEFMQPLGISVADLALALDLSEDMIRQIVLSHRAVTAEVAYLLGGYFDTSALFWLNLQESYDQPLLK